MWKLTKWALGVVVVLIVGFFAYNFFYLGHRDFIKYDYYLCEKGIYYTYPKGYLDAGWTYYDNDNKVLAGCSMLPNDKCKEISKLAGVCRKQGY